MTSSSDSERLTIRWDFFIAHAGSELEVAEELYFHLHKHWRVFLDSKCLHLGDDWDTELARAQREARITLVVVSGSTDRAYYQREEIAAALDLSRSSNHRVVPIFVETGGDRLVNIPYGLRLKHGIKLKSQRDVAAAVRRLAQLIADTADAMPTHSVSRPTDSQSGRNYLEALTKIVPDESVQLPLLAAGGGIFFTSVTYYLSLLPPWPPGYSLAVVTALLQTLSVFLVFKHGTSLSNDRSLSRTYIVSFASLVIVLIYLMVFSLFTIYIPPARRFIAIGYECSREALSLHGPRCPFLTYDDLAAVLFDETVLWTKFSLSVIRGMLIALWFGFLLCISFVSSRLLLYNARR